MNDSIDAATRAALEELLRGVERCWNALALADLEAVWDLSSPPLYLPEEADRLLLTWDDVRAYFRVTLDSIERMHLEIGAPQFVPLAPDLVSGFWEFHWDARIRGRTAPVGADNRAFAVFRRTPAGWKFAQYVEAPLAPIVYVRKLYERDVSAAALERFSDPKRPDRP